MDIMHTIIWLSLMHKGRILSKNLPTFLEKINSKVYDAKGNEGLGIYWQRQQEKQQMGVLYR